nr:unnamed protein product [Callosobruchus analis]
MMLQVQDDRASIILFKGRVYQPVHY